MRTACTNQAGALIRMASIALCICLVAVSLSGCGGPEDSPSMAAVRETLKQPGNARSSQSAPLANGVAVLVEDTAGYWVRDGKVYAVNGVAKELSGGISYAPQSIDMQAIQAAIGGSAQEQAVFSIAPERFLEGMNAILAKEAIAPLKKSTYWDYDLEAGEKGRAALRLSEWGGELSGVSVNAILKRGELSNFGPVLLMQGIMAIVTPSESADAREAMMLNLIMQLREKKDGEKVEAQVGTALYAMWRESSGVTYFEARPVIK
jgi:hypothetical protein